MRQARLPLEEVRVWDDATGSELEPKEFAPRKQVESRQQRGRRLSGRRIGRPYSRLGGSDVEEGWNWACSSRKDTRGEYSVRKIDTKSLRY